MLSKQGTWNAGRSLFDSDVIANDRQTKRNNDRDKQALQGESNGGRSDRNSRSNQRDDSIAEIFTTPEGEVYGFVDKEGNIYLDETVISPEHPIHEYTHLWDRVVAEKNPALWRIYWGALLIQ